MASKPSDLRCYEVTNALAARYFRQIRERPDGTDVDHIYAAWPMPLRIPQRGSRTAGRRRNAERIHV